MTDSATAVDELLTAWLNAGDRVLPDALRRAGGLRTLLAEADAPATPIGRLVEIAQQCSDEDWRIARALIARTDVPDDVAAELADRSDRYGDDTRATFLRHRPLAGIERLARQDGPGWTQREDVDRALVKALRLHADGDPRATSVLRDLADCVAQDRVRQASWHQSRSDMWTVVLGAMPGAGERLRHLDGDVLAAAASAAARNPSGAEVDWDDVFARAVAVHQPPDEHLISPLAAKALHRVLYHATDPPARLAELAAAFVAERDPAGARTLRDWISGRWPQPVATTEINSTDPAVLIEVAGRGTLTPHERRELFANPALPEDAAVDLLTGCRDADIVDLVVARHTAGGSVNSDRLTATIGKAVPWITVEQRHELTDALGVDFVTHAALAAAEATDDARLFVAFINAIGAHHLADVAWLNLQGRYLASQADAGPIIDSLAVMFDPVFADPSATAAFLALAGDFAGTVGELVAVCLSVR